jgi:hypothetical protein
VQLARKDAVAAEALLRQALPIRARAPGVVPVRRRAFPEDDWSVAATKSLLGAALSAQKRYDEAEALCASLAACTQPRTRTQRIRFLVPL